MKSFVCTLTENVCFRYWFTSISERRMYILFSIRHWHIRKILVCMTRDWRRRDYCTAVILWLLKDSNDVVIECLQNTKTIATRKTMENLRYATLDAFKREWVITRHFHASTENFPYSCQVQFLKIVSSRGRGRGDNILDHILSGCYYNYFIRSQ